MDASSCSKVLRGAAVLAAVLMVTLVFQAPQVAATTPVTSPANNAAWSKLGGSAWASSEVSGSGASYAIDGSTATLWKSSAGTGTLKAILYAVYSISEIHLHMASVAQPDLDFRVSADDAESSWTLVKSIRGNANLDVAFTFSSVTAKRVKVDFLTTVTHTHTTTSEVKVCDAWDYDEYTGRKYCYEYHYETQTTTYTDTHPPQVAEFEVYGKPNLDSDGDLLANGFEETYWYRQDVVVDGLPMAIPNNGTDVLSLSLDRPRWAGVGTNAVLDLEIDHVNPGDLAVAIGSWDGAAWRDKLVWAPGSFANASVWDTVVIQHTHTTTTTKMVCDWWDYDDYTGRKYCASWSPVTVTTTYTDTHLYPGRPAAGGTGERVLMSSGVSVTPSSSVASGSIWHVTIDLRKASLQSWEVSAGFRAPALSQTDLQGRSSWRILVRDWNPDLGGGSLRSATIRTEERSNPSNADTDGQLSDGAEFNLGAFPVALDTDFDALSDLFEKDPQRLDLLIDGASVVRTLKTDPTRADTDGDGLSDGEERTLGADRTITDPTTAWTDSDGLADGDEFRTYGTNATRSDSDGDTLSDSFEVSARTLYVTVNGVSTARTITTLPNTADSDGDGLRDEQENSGSTVYAVVTDPSDPDTDDDGLADGQERYAKEAALPSRKPVGTYLSTSLSITLTGTVEKGQARYSLSSIDISKFQVWLSRGSTWLLLRNYQGSGRFNYSSFDLPTSFFGGGTYTLTVYASVTGGVLEEFGLLFTLRTSPIKWDTDGDGLNDSEEVGFGQDAWITDPNRADTDADGWNDAYEIRTKGTNPLLPDTDMDGAADSRDIDPLRNLLVAVTVKRIHHGGPWCSPELVGVVRINDGYTWVTQHRTAAEDAFTSWACPPLIPTTQYSSASFYYTYYSDVPDDVSAVSVRTTSWSINSGRGDDVLVDASMTYYLSSGTRSTTFTNGDHWVTFDVWTTALSKTRTLLVTDGNVSVLSSTGQVRMSGSERFFVLTLDLSSAAAPFTNGLNTILVSRSVFLASKLKADFDAQRYDPLRSAALYGENLASAEMSEGVSAVIGGSLTGSQASDVLNRLLRDSAGSLRFSYTDISSQALVANLPPDVVRIIPWQGVAGGPTGAMPLDFWQKIGAVASAIVNALITVGQLLYKGLVALVTFLADLAQAIVDWGMKALGEVWNAVVTVAKAVADVLAEFLKALVSIAMAALHAIIDPILQTIGRMVDEFRNGILNVFRGLGSQTTADGLVTALGSVIMGSQLFFVVLMLTIGISVAEKITMIGSGGVGALVLNTLAPLIKDLLIVSIVTMAVVKVFNAVLPSEDQLTSLVPPQFSSAAKLTFGFSNFFQKLGLYYAAKSRDFASLLPIENAFRWAVLTFVLLLMRFAVDASGLPLVIAKAALILVDGLSLYIAWFVTMPSLGKAKGPLSRFYPLMFPVTEIMGVIAKVSSVATLIEDVAAFGDAAGAW